MHAEKHVMTRWRTVQSKRILRNNLIQVLPAVWQLHEIGHIRWPWVTFEGYSRSPLLTFHSKSNTVMSNTIRYWAQTECFHFSVQKFLIELTLNDFGSLWIILLVRIMRRFCTTTGLVFFIFSCPPYGQTRQDKECRRAVVNLLCPTVFILFCSKIAAYIIYYIWVYYFSDWQS